MIPTTLQPSNKTLDIAGVEYRRGKRRDGPVPVSTKIYQGLGALPGNHKEFAFNTFLLLYYNQILGVSATVAALVLGIALVIDAVTDPLLGAYSDQLRTKLGRRHPLMYVAALPLGVVIYLLFSPPDDVSQAFLIGWLFAFTIATHIAFTVFVVPWNALQAEFSEDYVERTSIVTYRHLVGWVVGAVFSVSVFTFVFAADETYSQGQLNPGNYPLFAVVVGVLVTFWCLLTTHLTKRDIPYLLQPVSGQALTLKSLVQAILLALKSPNFRLILFGVLIYFAIQGVLRVFDVYMNTFFWGLAAEDLRYIAGFIVIGPIAAFGAVPILQRRFQKHHVVITMLTAGMILGGLKVLLRFGDVLPANGESLLLVIIIIYVSVEAFCATIAGILFASMMADLVDEQELRVDQRQEGVFLSGLAFSQKAISSFGLMIGGLVLDHYVRFPAGDAQAPDPDVLFRLGMADGILVNAFLIVPIWLMTKYTLSAQALESVQAELAVRRQTRE